MLSPGLRDPEQELRAVSAATVLSPRAVERRQHERQVPAPEAPLVTVCVPVTSGPARENSFGRSGLSWASTGRAHGRGLRAPLPGGTAAGASEVLRVSHEHSGVAPGEVMAARTPSPYRRASFSPGSPHPPPPAPHSSHFLSSDPFGISCDWRLSSYPCPDGAGAWGRGGDTES